MNRPDNLVAAATKEARRAAGAWNQLWQAALTRHGLIVDPHTIADHRRRLLAAGDTWSTSCYLPPDRLTDLEPFTALPPTAKQSATSIIAGLAAWHAAPLTALVNPHWVDSSEQPSNRPRHDRPRWAIWVPLPHGTAMIAWTTINSAGGLIYPDAAPLTNELVVLACRVFTTSSTERIPTPAGTEVAIGFAA